MTRHPSSEALAALRSELAGRVALVEEPSRVRKRSRDFFWYSPVLNAQLNGLSADVVVEAGSEADVIAVASACARHGVPLTVRGGGTGNYGQAVPLQGGVLLDTSGLATIEWQRDGAVRTGPGIKMNRLDAELAPGGEEIRMHPSTKRTATIGGFIAGGSGGIGSVNYGQLRERGNIRAARVVTLEAEPKVLELTGDRVHGVAHAYGTTGIITALEMPLAPARPWIDVIVAFDDFLAAAECGLAVGRDAAIGKKLITPIAWPLPQWFTGLKAYCPEGQAILIAMIAEDTLPAFRARVAEAGGRITLETPLDDGPGSVPLYEYTWNHSTLQVLKTDRSWTYLQSLHPAEGLMESVAAMAARFPGEIVPHLELIEFAGKLTYAGIPLLKFTTEERLNAIIAEHEASGVWIANPHVYTLEDGTRHKRAETDQLGFKRLTDPAGLMNPGKMRSFTPADAEASLPA
ncbi:FAD-binding oxidoreductase [Methylobacterium organophilum]|uniref:FAD-binding oxidoreductase n=1 Tax=Methylobacterium organophilum TaxID=410 RepID=UPI001F12BFB5|nr:FAD-binding oxidoreductase [Methylobacterium organophilum]UMY17026.1 FAD-binding oxidoreductase [Methylobacterium organophilum]